MLREFRDITKGKLEFYQMGNEISAGKKWSFTKCKFVVYQMG